MRKINRVCLFTSESASQPSGQKKLRGLARLVMHRVHSKQTINFFIRFIGCNQMDHLTCDELCKSDSYWYGHCAYWDGTDFRCQCYEYNEPLKGSVCQNSQKYCMNICILKVSNCRLNVSPTAS